MQKFKLCIMDQVQQLSVVGKSEKFNSQFPGFVKLNPNPEHLF